VESRRHAAEGDGGVLGMANRTGLQAEAPRYAPTEIPLLKSGLGV